MEKIIPYFLLLLSHARARKYDGYVGIKGIVMLHVLIIELERDQVANGVQVVGREESEND